MREIDKIRKEDMVDVFLEKARRAKFVDETPNRFQKRAQARHSPFIFNKNTMKPMWIADVGVLKNLTVLEEEHFQTFNAIWPLCFGYSFRFVSEGSIQTQLINISSVHASEARKHCEVNATRCLKMRIVAIENGKYSTAQLFGGWNGREFNGFKHRHNNDLVDDKFKFYARDAMRLSLTFRYEWGAKFTSGDSPSFILPTTDRGILELFNDREKPHGNDRRSPLKHWVSEHSRLVGNTPSRYSRVMSHLRGNTVFEWRGYNVEIMPSAYDLDTLEKSKIT